jgi:hypothetical protein
VTEPVHPVATSDEMISALSERRGIASADPVLRSLEAWVQGIDSQPLAPWTRSLPPVAKTASSGELLRRVAALTLTLTVSSSGLATAVTGDPLSPLHFVKRQITSLHPGGVRGEPHWPGGRARADPGRAAVPQMSRSAERPSRPATRRPGSRVVRGSASP